jgi:hypothetical protein
LKMDISQLCDRRNDEIERKANLARRRIKEEKCQKAKARASKPKGIKDRRLQTVTDDQPIDSSTPLQQIPPSPPHEDEPMHQAGRVEVIIPTPVSQEQPEIVDIFLEKDEEGNASRKQQAPADDEVDEGIEIEKADPSPPNKLQAEPSGSKEENDKIEGELNASREKTTPFASSGSPTQMDVNPAPCSTSTQLEEEEKKYEEPMAQEGIVPPAMSQASEKEAVVPPVEENTVKEKALVPESR